MRPRCSEAAWRRRLALLALCAAAASCSRQHGPAAGAAQRAAPPSTWPPGLTEPLKITEELTIAIPLKYERNALSPGSPQRALLSVQSDRAEAQFDFFLPDFSGYTLHNYRNDTDPNKVEVVYLHAADPHEAGPDAPGEYPPNMLKRLLRDTFNPEGYQEQYGLRCYRGRLFTDRLACYGKRAGNGGEDILLYVPQPPYAVDAFPQMQARYFSQRYGGVRIAWRTHVQNLPRWRDIDAQAWKFLDAWKVAPPPAQPGRPGEGTAGESSQRAR